MAERIVDLLESIEIDDEHRQRFARPALGLGERLAKS